MQDIHMWGDKPYHSFDYEMKRRFGKKVYKLSFDAGFTCPNRDGKVGEGGCVFCGNGGSGDFAIKGRELSDSQIRDAIALVEDKFGRGERAFVAYFQSFTNTYADVDTLRKVFYPAILHPDICAVSIGTRPDCIPLDVLDLISEMNSIKPVWIELGLQTIHENSARFIRRGYDLSVFEESLKNLRSRDIECIVHVILGLPGESQKQILETVDYLGKKDIQGIKLQLLHVLQDTDLYKIYKKEPFYIFSMEEYIDMVLECVAILPEDIVIHRLTGDGYKKYLVEPKWSGDKKRVLNTLAKRFKETGVYQGMKTGGNL